MQFVFYCFCKHKHTIRLQTHSSLCMCVYVCACIFRFFQFFLPYSLICCSYLLFSIFCTFSFIFFALHFFFAINAVAPITACFALSVCRDTFTFLLLLQLAAVQHALTVISSVRVARCTPPFNTPQQEDVKKSQHGNVQQQR